MCTPRARFVITKSQEQTAIKSAQLMCAVGPWVPIKLITCGTVAAAWPMSVLYAVKYVTADVVAVIVRAFECSNQAIND